MSILLRQRRIVLMALITTISPWFPSLAGATNFNASISPPRFELKTDSGKVVRQVINITNHAAQSASYVVKTADWEIRPDTGLAFYEGAPDARSCRPWVRIERHKLVLSPQATRAYRFEVHVPKDAPSGQCRFSLLVEPDPDTIKPIRMGNISFPAVGRIAVIVYLTIGDGKADLRLRSIEFQEVEGQRLPVATFENRGNAHGRLFGVLNARDASGQDIELQVEQAPILPGQSKTLRLQAISLEDKNQYAKGLKWVAPIRIRGKIEWDGGSLKVDQVLK